MRLCVRIVRIIEFRLLIAVTYSLLAWRLSLFSSSSSNDSSNLRWWSHWNTGYCWGRMAFRKTPRQKGMGVRKPTFLTLFIKLLLLFLSHNFDESESYSHCFITGTCRLLMTPSQPHCTWTSNYQVRRVLFSISCTLEQYTSTRSVSRYLAICGRLWVLQSFCVLIVAFYVALSSCQLKLRYTNTSAACGCW